MTFETEGQTTDVNESQSSSETESQESSTSESSSQEQDSQTKETSSNQQQAKYVPYERFQELVEQKNTFAKELEQIKRQFGEMSKTSQAKPEEDALIKELRGLNPEFAKRFEAQQAALKELDGIKQWQQQVQADQVRSQAVSMVNTWHSANKISPELQDIYNSQIEAEIARNPRAGLNDLKGIYDTVHGRFSKILEGMKRAERESYVTDKKKDASIPSMPKGKAPANNQKTSEWSKDPAEARKQMVQRIRQQIRNESDA